MFEGDSDEEETYPRMSTNDDDYDRSVQVKVCVNSMLIFWNGQLCISVTP